MEVFQLQASNLRQRIVSIFGNSYNERLVPVQEETTLLNILGFVTKPEYAKKTRGEQFLFVNKRFVKDGYLNHAVQNSFEELLPKESYASYWLYLDIDPKKIDINIHPTKTEIKFDDERAVYAIVRASVKRSLGQYSVAPALDFEQERAFDIPYSMHKAPVSNPAIKVNQSYNPFAAETIKTVTPSFSAPFKISPSGWEKMYEDSSLPTKGGMDALLADVSGDSPFGGAGVLTEDSFIFQLHNSYIGTSLKSGMVILDQQAASERILYERYSHRMQQGKGPSQQELFPQTMEFTAADCSILLEMQDDIRALGFDLREFGKNTFVLHGTPADLEAGSEKQIIEELLEQYKNNKDDLKIDRRDLLAKSMAKNVSVKAGKTLSREEMKSIVNDLFACNKPYLSIDGKATLMLISEKELKDKFGK
jgi:DNA mismatch repair protein MutL